MAEWIRWRRLDLPGHEEAELVRRADGWVLSGVAAFTGEAGPCELAYSVSCDPAWHTTAASVRGRIGDREVDLDVAVDGDRRWRLDGVEAPSVAGCRDIDLGFSPSTNLLPIRRLSLAVGEAAEVRAAWLPFPSLVFEPLAQRYRRTGETTYRYESRGGRFVRALEVDRSGFVLRYPGFFEAEM